MEINTDNQDLFKVHKDKPKVKRKRVTQAAIYDTVSNRFVTNWNSIKLTQYEFMQKYKHLRIYEVRYK